MHKSGEILEVSPEECSFLVSTDGAVVVDAVKAPAAKPVEKPEKEVSKAEAPEKKVNTTRTAVKKPAAKKK